MTTLLEPHHRRVAVLHQPFELAITQRDAGRLTVKNQYEAVRMKTRVITQGVLPSQMRLGAFLGANGDSLGIEGGGQKES